MSEQSEMSEMSEMSEANEKALPNGTYRMEFLGLMVSLGGINGDYAYLSFQLPDPRPGFKSTLGRSMWDRDNQGRVPDNIINKFIETSGGQRIATPLKVSDLSRQFLEQYEGRFYDVTTRQVKRGATVYADIVFIQAASEVIDKNPQSINPVDPDDTSVMSIYKHMRLAHQSLSRVDEKMESCLRESGPISAVEEHKQYVLKHIDEIIKLINKRRF